MNSCDNKSLFSVHALLIRMNDGDRETACSYSISFY